MSKKQPKVKDSNSESLTQKVDSRFTFALLYLGLGPVIWIVFWPKPFYAITLVLLLLLQLFLMIWKIDTVRYLREMFSQKTLKQLLFSGFTGLVLSMLLGFGPYSQLSGDWVAARWEVYSWLIKSPWPSTSLGVTVVNGSEGVIRGYLGFYLPPAGFVKLLHACGIDSSFLIIYTVLWAWVAIGLSLGVFLVFSYTTSYKRLLTYVILFFCLSSLNIVGVTLTKGVHGDFWEYSWWSGVTNHLPNIISFTYPTNTAIGAALSLLLILQLKGKKNEIAIFLLATLFCAFWAPFTLPAILIVYCLKFKNIEDFWTAIRGFIHTRYLLIVSGSFFIIFAFLLFKFYSLPPSPTTFGFTVHNSGELKLLAIFQAINTLPLLVLLKYSVMPKKIFMATVVVLSCIPFFRIGAANDLNTKSTMPFLFLGSAYLIHLISREFMSRNAKPFLLVALAVFFSISSVNSISEISSRILNPKIFAGNFKSVPHYQNYSGSLSRVPCLSGVTAGQNNCPLSGLVFANNDSRNESSQSWANFPISTKYFRFERGSLDFDIEPSLNIADVSPASISKKMKSLSTSARMYRIKSHAPIQQTIDLIVYFKQDIRLEKVTLVSEKENGRYRSRIIGNEFEENINVLIFQDFLASPDEINFFFEIDKLLPINTNLEVESFSYRLSNKEIQKMCLVDASSNFRLFNTNFPCLYNQLDRKVNF